jgi:Carboxypeptidase regulatory-like domain/TonB dependent receptor-like, beta-barrel
MSWTSLLLAVILIASPSWSQQLGTIEGKVVDARNSPIPAATVRLSSSPPGPPLETLAEIDGTFSFPNLPSGTYQLVVEMRGFEKFVREGVEPAVGAASPLTVALRRLQPAPAPQRPPIQPDRTSAAMERTRPGETAPAFAEIGLAGLGIGNGAPIVPGDEAVAPMREDNSDLLVISGTSTASLASGDWNDPAFRERMMEMRERMGLGGGEGPMFAGGGGGGRFGEGGGFGGGRPGFPGGRGMGRRQPRLNGSIYSSYRNSVFNARPYSITGNEVTKPLQIQNNFGVSVGGALPWGGRAPARNRGPQQPGMWFFSYEGSRNRTPFDVLTTVPTELERAGDFSRTSLRAGVLAGRSVTLFDPASGASTVFPENRIPGSRMNPAAVSLLEFVPLPNLPGSVQNFTMQRGLVNTSDSFSARLNTRLSTKDNIFVNYSTRSGDGITSQIFPGLDSSRETRAQNVVIGGMHRFRPRLIANYRILFNRVRTLSVNSFAFKEDIAGQLGIQGVSREPINYGVPTVNFTNYGDLQLGNPSLTRNQTLTFGGGLNRIGSIHTVQAGGELSWNHRDSQVDPNARGTFDFTGFATSSFDPEGRPVAGTGYDLADFLLGFPYSTSRRFGSSINYLRNKNFSLFLQDNWRLRPNVTINFGLRYEYIQPFYEKYDHIVSLDVAPGFGAVAQVFPDQSGPYTGHFPRSLLFADKNNLGPRIGVAWKPKASSRWVLRAGYGLSNSPSVYPYIYSQLVGQPPFAIGQNILTTLTAPLTLQNGFPVDPNVTILNSYAIDPYYRIGYVQQWNFSIQTQFLKLYTLDVGYNAAKGTRLDILRAPNRAPAGGSPISTEDNRVIGNAGNFVYQSSGANSILHGFQARLNRRFSQGFRMENSYTLAKSIDNASGIGGSTLLVVQDERNIRAERSLSSFDQRHRFQSDFSAELPFGRQRRFLAAASPLVLAVTSGWTLSGSYQLNTGTPLMPRILGNVSNNSGTGSNASERPDATGTAVSLPRDQRTTARYFNTLAFAIPAPGTFGNAARYSIAGPGTNLLSLAVRKNFRLSDNGRRLEFRWQVSNVLNHPSFSGVGTVINALSFGRVTGARSMRQMDFNLRLNF